MSMNRRILLVLCAVVCVALIACTTSLAAPVTVNLRVEGINNTIFEGPITTEAQPIEAPLYETTGPSNPHPCDVNENGAEPLGSYGSSYGTPTTALYDAAQSLGLTLHAYWYEPLHDFFVEGLGEPGPAGTEAWEYAVNYTTANVGGCQFRLAPGSNVLWAANYGLVKHLLDLSGPSSVEAGVPFTVDVTDGQTGEPIGGASIGEDINGVTATIPSSPTTNANGDATITLSHTGNIKLKATQPESVRSNGLTVTVASAPCACDTISPTSSITSTPDVTDVARVGSVISGHTYPRRTAPRILTGVVSVPADGTLRQVRIGLKRKYRGRCYDFNGARGQFVHMKCSRPVQFFSVGSSQSFSYLLPSRLTPGQYVYEIEAVNDAGQTTTITAGISRVTFEVK